MSLFFMSTSIQFLYSIMSAVRNIIYGIYHSLLNSKGIFALQWTKGRQRTVCVTSYIEARWCKYSCCEKAVSIKYYEFLSLILSVLTLLVILVRFSSDLIFLRHVFEKSPNIKLNENPSSGRRDVPCGHTDTRRS